ncbi:MAG: hypothetical protein ACP5UI_01145 [Thermoprotei archaeon]|nr:hypothetical protein [TACK group archaeon]
MKVAEVVHFDANKRISSQLTADDIPPSLNEGGFVERGGFYISLKDAKGTRVVLKLSDMEAVDLAERLLEAYRQHVAQEYELSRRRRGMT